MIKKSLPKKVEQTTSSKKRNFNAFISQRSLGQNPAAKTAHTPDFATQGHIKKLKFNFEDDEVNCLQMLSNMQVTNYTGSQKNKTGENSKFKARRVPKSLYEIPV